MPSFWTRYLNRRAFRSTRPQRRTTRRPLLEMLEDRVVPTTGPGELGQPVGTLLHTGDAYNPTHWSVREGDTITDQILNATDVAQYVHDGNQVDVWIKSSQVGNTLVEGTVSGTTITFTWKVFAPDANGGNTGTGDICFTTNVAYGDLGNTTNNFLNPKRNGAVGTAGFAIVEPDGTEDTDCGTARQTPSITTRIDLGSSEPDVEGVGSVPLGSYVHDGATVSGSAGTPTGFVVFTFYKSDGTQIGNPSDPEDLDASGTVEALDFVQGPLAAGDYYFIAHYLGDPNYTEATGDKEPLHVNKGGGGGSAAQVTTTIENDADDSPVTGPVPLGTSVHDSATVTSPVPIAPTGTVSFTFFKQTPVNVNIYSGFSDSGGGAPYSGLVGSFTSPDIQFATDNGYNWHPFGQGAFGADMTGTLVVAADGTYTFSLDSDDGSQLYIDGGLVIDNGGPHGPNTVSGSAALTAGVHTFEVQFFEDFGGPSGVDLTLPNGVCYGNSPSDAGTVALVNGVADPSTVEGPLGAGSYAFLAHYNGDSNYDPADSDCEHLTVNKADTTIVTHVLDANGKDVTGTKTLAPGTVVHDTATVGTQVGNFVITGTVTYTWYNTYDCTGTAVGSQTVTMSGGLVPDSPTWTPPSGAHSYCAVYNGDSNYNSSPIGAPEPFGILGHQNGLTLGFYSNKNGQAALTGSTTGKTLLASVYNPLFGPGGVFVKPGSTTTSVLVNASGVPQPLSYFQTYANVQSFLLNATATNMGYMLSAQLLTTEFNIVLGKVDATKSIYVPAVLIPSTGQHMSSTLQNSLQTNGVSSGGVAKISDIIAASIAQLIANPNTNYTNPTAAQTAIRNFQEALKDCLDGINNNQDIFLP